jgi:hypothetical protein
MACAKIPKRNKKIKNVIGAGESIKGAEVGPTSGFLTGS